MLEGCLSNTFYGVPDDFTVFIPCGSLNAYKTAWSEDLNFHEYSIDTSITVVTSDPCYTWNDQTYCASGDYIQTFPTLSGCDSVVTLHLTITTGINDYTGHNRNIDNAMTVYPNPTNGIVNVQFTDHNSPITQIHVYDIYGKLLGVNVVGANDHSHIQQATAQIDLSRYANGVYFIKAVGNGNVMGVRKVVRQ